MHKALYAHAWLTAGRMHVGELATMTNVCGAYQKETKVIVMVKIITNRNNNYYCYKIIEFWECDNFNSNTNNNAFNADLINRLFLFVLELLSDISIYSIMASSYTSVELHRIYRSLSNNNKPSVHCSTITQYLFYIILFM